MSTEHPMSDDTETQRVEAVKVAAVLAAHNYRQGDKRCGCGHPIQAPNSGEHERHQAEMLVSGGTQGVLPHTPPSRNEIAAAYEPDAFDPDFGKSSHPASQIQWAARRTIAAKAADRLLASDHFAARAAGDDLAVEREGDDYVVKVSCDYDIDRIEELLESVAALAYEKFPHLNPLLHGHRRECEEPDHCCGPGSNYLRDHDAEVLTTDRERVALAIEALKPGASMTGEIYLDNAARIARSTPGEGGAE